MRSILVLASCLLVTALTVTACDGDAGSTTTLATTTSTATSSTVAASNLRGTIDITPLELRGTIDITPLAASLGKTLAAFTADVEALGGEVRVVVRDGADLPVNLDLRLLRVDVAVESSADGDVVVGIVGTG